MKQKRSIPFGIAPLELSNYIDVFAVLVRIGNWRGGFLLLLLLARSGALRLLPGLPVLYT